MLEMGSVGQGKLASDSRGLNEDLKKEQNYLHIERKISVKEKPFNTAF